MLQRNVKAVCTNEPCAYNLEDVSYICRMNLTRIGGQSNRSLNVKSKVLMGEINMEIIRNGGKYMLTNEEICEAHKEFVTSWMKSELENEYELTAAEAETVAKDAYDIYSDGNGHTEYEAIEEAYQKYTGEGERENYMYEKLKQHVGHDVVCVAYGDVEEPIDICIECEECGMVLVSAEDYE